MKKNDKRYNWTPQEIKYIKKHCDFFTIPELAFRLRRTKSSIQHKLTRMGYLATRKPPISFVKTNIPETDKAYLAAALDGEGCITLSRQFKNNSRNISPMVIFSNTNLEWLQELKAMVGTGTVYERKRAFNPKWKPSHRLQLASRQASWLLQELMPYLKIKKEQAKLILSFPRFGKAGRGNFSPQIQATRLKMVEQIHILNRRGLHPGNSSK